MTVPAAVSAALHVALLALALLPSAPAAPPASMPIEVELVQQTAQVQGSPAPPSSLPPQAAAASAGGAEPAPAPPAASKPAPVNPPASVHLGNSAEDVAPLSVTGDNIVPPGPDPRFHNQPPTYPADAALIGAHGTVQLVVHIAPSGVPLDVTIAASSGNRSLDFEARRAVLLWRFRPAQSGGQAVPYDYVINIRFALGDQ